MPEQPKKVLAYWEYHGPRPQHNSTIENYVEYIVEEFESRIEKLEKALKEKPDGT